jgi:hypothetical protein
MAPTTASLFMALKYYNGKNISSPKSLCAPNGGRLLIFLLFMSAFLLKA